MASTDDPTFEEYTAAGYDAATYPPAGHAEVDSPALREYRLQHAAPIHAHETVHEMARKAVPITDTTKPEHGKPFDHSAEARVQQDRLGQQELISNTTLLPTQGLDHPHLAKMGVVVQGPHPTDPLFSTVTLPEGWHLRPSVQPGNTIAHLWSDLCDADGNKRAEVFYQAQHTDRRASIRIPG